MPSLIRPSLIREFWLDRRSAAAMEFYFVATFLIILIIGVFDISEAMIYEQEVYDAAHSMAASASNIAVNAGTGATNLSFSQIELAESMIWADVPGLRSNFQDGAKSVTISSVVFEPTFTTSTCTTGTATNPCYVPVVVWSVAYTGGDAPATTPPGTFTVSSNNSENNLPFQPETTGGAEWGGSASCGATFTNGTNAGTTGTTLCQAEIIGLNSGNNKTEYANAPLRPCDSYASSPAPPAYPFEPYIGSLNQTVQTGGSSSDLTSLRTLTLTEAAANVGTGALAGYSQTGPVAPPAPMLVVDIHFQYTPLLGLILNNSSIDYYVNAYWPVRSVESTIVTTNASGAETITPLTLYKQFTTITAASIPTASGSYKDYCVNYALAGATT